MTDVAVSPVIKKPRSRLLRSTYFILGLVCLGGVYLSFLPGIPTFDLVMLSAFFFARSSDRFHDWLINHRVFGRIISSYRGAGLTKRTKLVAAVGIVSSLGFSILVLIDSNPLRLVLVAVGAYALWFVFSRPTRSVHPPETA